MHEESTLKMNSDNVSDPSNVRARGADEHLGSDKGLAGMCPAISVVTAI
jgi:hypothetical protein